MIEVATALPFDKNQQLLVYLRDDNPTIPFPNYWDLFGGHVEPGESAETALLREIQEELGIEVQDYQFFRKYECLEGDVSPNTKYVYLVHTDKQADELTLYEGQYHKGIDLIHRHEYKFANILGKIIDEYVESCDDRY